MLRAKQLLMLISTMVLLPSAANAKVYSHSEANEQWLGKGLYHKFGHLTDAGCVTPGQPEFEGAILNEEGNRSASILLRLKMSSVDSVSTSTEKQHQRVNYLIGEDEKSYEKFSRLSKSRQSMSTSLHYLYEGKKQALRGASLSNTGVAASQLPPNEMAAICGDSFISALKYGHELYVKAEMRFKSRSSYKSFKSSFTRESMIFDDASEATSQLYRNGSSDGKYVIRVVSTLVPDAVLRILNDGTSMHCDESNMAECVTALNELMAYLSGPDGYAAWLAELEDSDSLPVLYYHADSYLSHGLGAIQSETPFVTDHVRHQVRTILTTLLHYQDLKDTIDTFALSFNDYIVMNLKLNSNISILKEALSACQGAAIDSVCNAEVNDLIDELQQVELE